jgi:hypothetical protein
VLLSLPRGIYVVWLLLGDFAARARREASTGLGEGVGQSGAVSAFRLVEHPAATTTTTTTTTTTATTTWLPGIWRQTEAELVTRQVRGGSTLVPIPGVLPAI